MDADIDVVLDALGDPTRRRIIGRLANGPLDVGGISAGMPVGRTAVSMHLRVLRDAGLVSDTPAGNRRVYRLEPEALRNAERWIAAQRTIWENRLDRLGEYLAEPSSTGE